MSPTRDSNEPSKVLVIGIAGGTGSGKSTIARAIVAHFRDEDVNHIQHDAYYRTRSTMTAEERARVNYDHPDSLDNEQLVADLVVEPFDHTFLNKDVEHFASTVPTAENIALHIADLLSAPIAATGARLHKVRLQESPNNAAEVFAEVPALGMQPQALEALASA